MNNHLAAERYAYFPLHVTDDYKIKRIIPHCPYIARWISRHDE